ncbi:MAG: hypothetical protein JWM27_750 [Gemmatimonadetes bacterium]|nr:hypothetical protein [Gemmatimonadota bacterium]
MSSNHPQINGLITFLERHDPEGLAEIRTRYPDPPKRSLPAVGATLGSAVLGLGSYGLTAGSIAGLTLGGAEDTHPQSSGRLYVEVAIRSLKTAVDRAGPNTHQLRARLYRAKSLRTVGSALGALTGAGLVGILLVGQKGAVPAIAAFVNFSSTLAVLWAGHLETALHGGKGSLIDVFEQVTGATVRAEQLLQVLEVHRSTNPDSPKAIDAINDANTLAIELRSAELRLWG